MKTTILLLTAGLLMFNQTFGQDKEKYTTLKNEAMKHYDSKSYARSAATFRAAFDVLGGKAYPNDRYNAACSYSLAGNIDTAFYHLFRLANDSKFRNLGHITVDSDLDTLHSDNRWEELIVIVKANKAEAEKDLEKPLVALLDSIYREDQKYRMQLGEIEEKFGRKSDEMKAHWKIINEKDSANLIVVKKILDERGWLGPKVIGNQGNSTLFLVIQHADLETQLTYLPMMREAVKKGNARGSSLALLEDRTALGHGKKQIYGSQIGRDPETGEYFVQPLIDPENVDKRRAEVGLGTMADYVSHWNVTWDVERHKKRIEESEKAAEAEKP